MNIKDINPEDQEMMKILFLHIFDFLIETIDEISATEEELINFIKGILKIEDEEITTKAKIEFLILMKKRAEKMQYFELCKVINENI